MPTPFCLNNHIYAFGMLLWEIATRKIPYEGINREIVQLCVLIGQREELPKGCPEGYIELMQQCWDHDAQKRPTIDQILNQLQKIKLLLNVCDSPSFETSLHNIFFRKPRQLVLSNMTSHRSSTSYLSQISKRISRN